MSDLFEILSASAPKLLGGSGRREASPRFETDGTAQVTLVGYTADEIKEILATYREHVNLMMDQAASMQSRMDQASWSAHDHG